MYISVITLNYKKSNLTINCINSLYEQFKNDFKDNKMELIIVDNASGDDSVKLINEEIKRKEYKNISVIESKENGGFSKGCNIGARLARGKFLLFLNNDTFIKDKGILEMADYLNANNNVSILGGQLKNEDGSSQPSSGKFYTLSRAMLLLLGGQKFGFFDKNPNDISKVDWVKGALLMIRKEIFDNLNGFDEKIFMYTEDMELCFRAKQKGFATYFYPFVNVVHKDYGSTNRTFAVVNIYKNLLYFYKKHKTFPEYLILKSLLLIKAYLLIILGVVSKNNYLKDTYSQALKAI